MLTWSQSDRVVGFRNDYRNYAGDVFHHGNATPLPAAAKQLTDASYRVNGKTYHLQDYLQRQNVSGMLVLKDGKIAWKYLGQGNTDATLWTSRSVGKSVVATLVGVAIKQGKIRSLDDLITQYEPDLKGTAWDGVTLRQLITHTSGVAWNEDYTNPKSDFAQLTECEAKPGTYACVRWWPACSVRIRLGRTGLTPPAARGCWAMCWSAPPACRWRPICSKASGSRTAWRATACGMPTPKASTTWARTALTPRWKTGGASANLFCITGGCRTANRSCRPIG